MLRSIGPALTAAVLCLLPNLATAQLTAGTGLPTQASLARYGLERSWWNQASLNSQRDRVVHLTADEDAVYVQASSGTTTAFDLQSGRRLWSLQLGRPDHPSIAAVTTEDEVLITIGMTLYGVDKFSGRMLWQIRLPSYPSTRPTTDGVRVYLGMLDGSLYAYNLETIHQLYNENLLPQWSEEALRWRYSTAGAVTTPAVVAGLAVCFASQDGSLYAVTAADRDIIFQFETTASASAPLEYANGLLYLPTKNYKLYCIDVLSGQTRWDFVSGAPVNSKPVVFESDLFLTPDRGGLYCLSPATGRQKWWRPRLTELLAVTPQIIYSSDEDGNVVVLDRKEGASRGVLPLQRFTNRVHNERTDRLIVASPSGLVVCIHERGREYPIYHEFPELRPILPEFAPEAPEAAETSPTAP